MDTPKKNGHRKEKKDVNLAKLETRNVPVSKAPKFTNESTGVNVTLLKGTLNRFRLVGPESGQVLAGTLMPTEVNPTTNEAKSWWTDEYSTADAQGAFEAQNEALKSVIAEGRPSDIRTGSVVALTVRDPRMGLPKHR